MRITGPLLAAIIALALGAWFRHTSATASVSWWPYFVGGYGFLSAIVPWLVGGIEREELTLRYSVLIGVFVAIPLAVAAHWLRGSAYHSLAVACWVLIAGWGVHLLISVINLFRRPQA